MAAHEGSDHAEQAERRDIGDAPLEQLRADLIRLSAELTTAEPLSVFRDLRRLRSRIYVALDRQLWPRDQTELYFLLGALHCLMAVAADYLGYSQAGEGLLRAGWAYATAIDHRPLMAHVWIELAGIAYWQRPRQSRDLAQSGLRYLADGPNAAQLHLQYARAAARLGDAATAQSAIASATEARERSHRDELLEIGGEFGFSRATQHFMAGSPDPSMQDRLTWLEHAECMTTVRPAAIDLGQVRPGSQESVPPAISYAHRTRACRSGPEYLLPVPVEVFLRREPWRQTEAAAPRAAAGVRNTAGPMGRARSHRLVRARGGCAVRR
jgi:hypothetical protein